jgi:pyridoxine 5-phosphate synthase
VTKLSVNINKIATLRNARGGNIPDLLHAAEKIQSFGADGITVHPRPDERHVRFQDVRDLRKVVHTELNVEGYPSDSFLELVEEVRPEQVTLVPDPPGVITSNAGWDTIRQATLLKQVVQRLKSSGMRVSIFLNPDPSLVKPAKDTGADRIELYTESYAAGFGKDPEDSISLYRRTAEAAQLEALGLNAGHDLNLENLTYFHRQIPSLLEVSIGHALISDALYLGLEETVKRYLACLK